MISGCLVVAIVVYVLAAHGIIEWRQAWPPTRLSRPSSSSSAGQG